MIDLTDLAIEGSGGGGGGGGSDEAPNTLRSRTWYNILLFLSEGEVAPISEKIERRIFLNGTPIESSDGTLNYRGVTVAYRNGSVSQTPIPVATNYAAGATTAVGQKISTAVGPVTRTYANPAADGIVVSLSTPGLRAKQGNDITGSYVQFRIDISNNNGAFVTYLQDSFDGKTTGYARDYQIKVSPSGPWTVRVTRLTPDVPAADIDKATNDLIWDKTTLIFDDKLSYPNTALVFIRLDSVFFRSEPTIAIKASPMMLLVPDNYDPVAKTYTGSWTGNFKKAATDNPAWVVYNFLVNRRWGIGKRIKPELVDKWGFYAFGKHCDVKINNGTGVDKPRHTFNQYIRTQSDAVKGINAILEAARAGVYESGGQLVLIYDRAGRPIGKPFTNSNVLCKYDESGKLTEPGFSYECSHINDLPSAVNAKWYDPSNFDKPDFVRATLQDIGLPELLDRYGDRELDLDLPWCHNPWEAMQYARWKLASAHLEQWTVNFMLDEPGMLRLPGDLIAIQDNEINNTWVGGKVKSSAIGQIELDRAVEISGNGTLLFEGAGTTQDLPILNPTSATPTSIINCAVTAANLPAIGSEWLLNLNSNKVRIFRIVSVSNPEGNYRILAREYAEQKYIVADGGQPIIATKSYWQKPNPPTQLKIYYDPNFTHVGWLPPLSLGIDQYLLEYQNFATGIWQPIYINANFTDYNLPATTAPYSVRIAAIGHNKITSDWVYGGVDAASSATTNNIGIIVDRNPNGTVTLDKPVFLSYANEGKYWLTVDATGGSTGTEGGSTYRQVDRRVSFVNPGLTTIINTENKGRDINNNPNSNPYGFLGDVSTFIGVTGLINSSLNNAISYLVASGPDISARDAVSNPDTPIPPGTYDLRASSIGSITNDSISYLTVPSGSSLYVTQHVPGQNPRENSPWILSVETDVGTLANYASSTIFQLGKTVSALVSHRLMVVFGDETRSYPVISGISNSLTVDTGLIESFTAGTATLSVNLATPASPINNKAKYLVVIGGTAVVFSDAFAGISQPFNAGTYDLSLYPIGASNVSSINVFAGATAILTEKAPAIEPYPIGSTWKLLRVD
jgi:Putative phage tail protein